MRKIVECIEKIYYRIVVDAEDDAEALEKVKDNLPDWQESYDSWFEDFEVMSDKEMHELGLG